MDPKPSRPSFLSLALGTPIAGAAPGAVPLAETLPDNLAKLLQISITPQRWIDNMNARIGK